MCLTFVWLCVFWTSGKDGTNGKDDNMDVLAGAPSRTHALDILSWRLILDTRVLCVFWVTSKNVMGTAQKKRVRSLSNNEHPVCE